MSSKSEYVVCRLTSSQKALTNLRKEREALDAEIAIMEGTVIKEQIALVSQYLKERDEALAETYRTMARAGESL